MPTFIARSGSFNDLKITNLASSSKANIVAIDSASGQLYYMSTASFGGGGSNISFYNGNTQLTSTLTSLVITGSKGLIAVNNGNQVTMSVVAAGADTQIQFNSGSTFSGSSNFIYNYVSGNLIYSGLDPYNIYSPSPNDPNNSYNSVLIGLGLTGSYIETGFESIFPNSIVLGYLNSYLSFDSIDYRYTSFAIGNGYIYDGTRENAIEIGREFGYYPYPPFIRMPQLYSSSTGYNVTIDPTTKQLFYTKDIYTPGGNDTQIQFNSSSLFSGSANLKYNYNDNKLILTGSLNISGSEYILGSGSSVLKIDGTTGPLLTVNDSNIGSLFTVNDISGLTILDVRSDSSVLIGSSISPSLNVTKTLITTASQAYTLGGTFIPTASYNAAFFEYVAYSASNARAGNISAVWSGSTIASSSTTTTSIGTTTGLTTFAAISGSYIVLSGSANAASWTIKSIIRAI